MRVVPAVPPAAHRADHAVLRERVLEGMTCILATPVRVAN